jgi:hypothetical protein
MEFVYADSDRGARKPLIRSEGYATRKYNGARIRSLELGSNDFLIFEHADRSRRDAGQEGKVVMSYPHLHLLFEGLGRALAELPACWERVDSRYFRPTARGYELHDSFMRIEGLHAGGAIGLAPDIFPAEGCEDDAEPVGDPAVRMYVNGVDYFGLASYEGFKAFETYYGNFDLSRWAGQAMAIATQSGVEPEPERESAPQPRRAR